MFIGLCIICIMHIFCNAPGPEAYYAIKDSFIIDNVLLDSGAFRTRGLLLGYDCTWLLKGNGASYNILHETHQKWSFSLPHNDLGGIERSFGVHLAVHHTQCIIRQRSCQAERPLVVKHGYKWLFCDCDLHFCIFEINTKVFSSNFC